MRSATSLPEGCFATPDAGTRLAGHLTCQWQELLRLRRQVLAHFEHEAIHDLRVASRRMRSALAVLPPLLGKKRVSRLNRPIRQLTRELGELRNLDEARHYLRTLADDGLTVLIARLDRKRQTECRRVHQLLHELKITRLNLRLKKLCRLLSSAPSDNLATLLADRSLILLQSVQTLISQKGLADQALERHQLRILIKKWRYSTELAVLLGAKQQLTLLKRLKRYQGLLGELNDREVFLQLITTATCLTAACRERVVQTITRQHRTLVRQFKQLLQRQPLPSRLPE